MRKKPDKHTGNVFFVENEKPPRNPNLVDTTFAGYGGVPDSVDNWQAIALTAIDIFSQLMASNTILKTHHLKTDDS